MSAIIEQVAKGPWCPMVRHEGGSGASLNRSHDDSNPANADTNAMPDEYRGKYGCHCIASRCAMWRWADDPLPQFCRALQPDAVVDQGAPDGCKTWEFVPYNPEDDSYEAGWLEPIGEAQKRRKGYCGIAGKPLGAP